jgi:hypothetical protein
MKMNTHCCKMATATVTRGRDDGRPAASGWRRWGGIAGWSVPGVILALLPKCPVCVAAYVALATGIGLSLPAAKWLRAGVVVSCVAWLALLAVWSVRHTHARNAR